jgi:hypothetical protein
MRYVFFWWPNGRNSPTKRSLTVASSRGTNGQGARCGWVENHLDLAIPLKLAGSRLARNPPPMQTYLQRQPWCSAPIESTGSAVLDVGVHKYCIRFFLRVVP